MPPDTDLAALERRAQQLIGLFEDTVIETWPDFRDTVNRAITSLDHDLIKLRLLIEREANTRPVQQAVLDRWRQRQEHYLIGLGVATGLLLLTRLVDMLRGQR